MSTLTGEGTILVLDGIGIPLLSAVDATQTLEPIENARNMRRDVNGTLVDLSRESHRKYASKISCTFNRPPAFDGIWPGMEVTVHCCCEMTYPVSGQPGRPVVSGSEHTEGDFVSYRPILVMKVINNTVEFAEWQAEYSWELELEEV